MSFVLILVATTLIVVCFQYLWGRRKIYALANKLNGPTALPIIGNALMLNKPVNELYDVLNSLLKSYKHPMRLWLGPKLIVVISDLKDVEKIMSSTKITHKSEIYKFLSEFAGVGLITHSGPLWKQHRKIIAPMFSLSYVYSNLNTIQKYGNALCKSLDGVSGAGTLNFWKIVHQMYFCMFADILFGVELDAEDPFNVELMKCFDAFYDNAFNQVVKPWLHIPFIFNLTKYGAERRSINSTIRAFLTKVLLESRTRVNGETSPIVDQINNVLKDKPSLMDDQSFVDHLFTLFAASEDPASLITSAICLCFGMYPEQQKLAAEEVCKVLGNDARNISMEDLGQLKFLEMCINDVLRLFPIGPFVVRKSTEELGLTELTIPAGCEVLIPIDVLHRNPDEWENPHHFHPQHFAEEAVAQRNQYSYMPFSAGPRKCIGKHLAMQCLKVVVAMLLQRYTFDADGKYPDLKFKTDISLRVVNGYNLRVSKRIFIE